MSPVAQDQAARNERGRPPECLRTLVDRFDPSVIDVPDGRARIRIVVPDGGEWDIIADAEGARLTPARPVLG
jgi:hypothetical protein